MANKYPYTWIKRATPREKDLMRQVVEGLNELAYEDYETLGFVLEYRLERCGDAWGAALYIARVHPDIADQYQVGQRFDGYSLVRCSTCGGVRELADGQGEFCLACDADWEEQW